MISVTRQHHSPFHPQLHFATMFYSLLFLNTHTKANRVSRVQLCIENSPKRERKQLQEGLPKKIFLKSVSESVSSASHWEKTETADKHKTTVSRSSHGVVYSITHLNNLSLHSHRQELRGELEATEIRSFRDLQTQPKRRSCSRCRSGVVELWSRATQHVLT